MKFSALQLVALCGLVAFAAQPVVSQPQNGNLARFAVEPAKRHLRSAKNDDEGYDSPDEDAFGDGNDHADGDEGADMGQWSEGMGGGDSEGHNDDWSMGGKDEGTPEGNDEEGTGGVGMNEGGEGDWSKDTNEGEDDHGPEGMENDGEGGPSDEDASEPMQDEGN